MEAPKGVGRAFPTRPSPMARNQLPAFSGRKLIGSWWNPRQGRWFSPVHLSAFTSFPALTTVVMFQNILNIPSVW